MKKSTPKIYVVRWTRHRITETTERFVRGTAEQIAASYGLTAIPLYRHPPFTPAPADVVTVPREEWAELRGIESCVRAVMAYDGLVGTEERNRLKRLDALRSIAQAGEGGAR